MTEERFQFPVLQEWLATEVVAGNRKPETELYQPFLSRSDVM